MWRFAVATYEEGSQKGKKIKTIKQLLDIQFQMFQQRKLIKNSPHTSRIDINI